MAELPSLVFYGKRTGQCNVADCEELGDAWEFDFTAAVPMKKDESMTIIDVECAAKFCEGHKIMFEPALALRTSDWSFSIAVPTGEEDVTDVE